jgi:tRNA A-37 threonylcarbamoyl transferase component Bud32
VAKPEAPDPGRRPPDLEVGKAARERGLITPEQLREALAQKAREAQGGKPGRPLTQILIDKGWLTRSQIDQLVAAAATAPKPPSEPSKPAPAPSFPPFGKYAILREIGKGGMGVVYEATDTELKRRVALKMMLTNPNADPEEAKMDEERFLRESRLTAAIPRHPHIVGVYEAGVLEGKRYLAMEYIEGKPMNEWRREGSIAIRQQMTLLRDVLLAIHHAHEHGVIHRDMKPHNVLVDDRHQPHVLDFGLAKKSATESQLSLTAPGMFVGTPAYMSPEQAQGLKSTDRRTDIYAIGVMLYEVLTGRAPFTGETPIEILTKAIKNPVPLPSTVVKIPKHPAQDKGMEGICLKALAKNPRDRYQTAAAFARDLTRWLKGEQVRVTAPPRERAASAEPARKPVKWIVAGVVAGVGVIAAAVVAAVVLTQEPSPAPSGTEQPLARAQKLMREGKFELAEQEFADVVRKEPANAAAKEGQAAARAKLFEQWLAEGDKALASGEVARAEIAYTKVLDKDRTHAAAIAGLKAVGERRGSGATAAPTPAAGGGPLMKGDHGGAVLAVAASSRRNLIASGGVDEIVKLWDANKRELVGTVVDPGGRIEALAFSPDGAILASAARSPSNKAGEAGHLRLWTVPDVGDPQLRKSLEGHTATIFAMDFSPDGSTLATGSYDWSIRLWDVQAGRTVTSLKGHDAGVLAVRYSPDGSLLASGDFDAVAHLWDMGTGKLKKSLVGHAKVQDGVFAAAISPDGALLATGGSDHAVFLWNLKTGEKIQELRKDMHAVFCLAFSKSGRVLATGGGDGRVALWDAATGEPRKSWEAHPKGVWCMTLSADGKALITGGLDDAVKVWDAAGW